MKRHIVRELSIWICWILTEIDSDKLGQYVQSDNNLNWHMLLDFYSTEKDSNKNFDHEQELTDIENLNSVHQKASRYR